MCCLVATTAAVAGSETYPSRPRSRKSAVFRPSDLTCIASVRGPTSNEAGVRFNQSQTDERDNRHNID
jgi:hypothetical protein